MKTLPFIQITPDGVAFLQAPPAEQLHPGNVCKPGEIKVSIHPDLTLELHGENFSIKRPLSVADALGCISLLGWQVQQNVCYKRGIK